MIFGKTNPSGRLPFTYQKHQNGPTLLYYHKLRQRDYDVECEFVGGSCFVDLMAADFLKVFTDFFSSSK